MRTIFTILSIILSLSSFAQSLKIEWQQCIGGPRKEELYDMVHTGDGFLLTGLIPSDTNVKRDVLLIKTDLEGNVLWQKRYGGTNDDGGVRILPTLDGNYYLAGASSSLDGDISYNPFLKLNFWILKIDPEGNIIWEKIFGGNGYDHIWDAAVTTDGGLVAYGFTDSNDGDISVAFGADDAWLIKINSEGQKEWDFTLGDSFFDYGQAVLATSDNGVLITCTNNGRPGGNTICAYSVATTNDLAIAKLNSNGEVEWQQCIGGSKPEGHFAASVEIPDGYLLACYVRSADGDATGSGYHEGWESNQPAADIWLVKIDLYGEIVWQKCYGGTKGDYPYSIFKTGDGYVVVGRTSSIDYDVTDNHSPGYPYTNIWVLKVGEDGEIISSQCFGGSTVMELHSAVVKLSDTHFIIGSNFQYSYDLGQITCQPVFVGDQQIWLISVMDATLGVNEMDVIDKNIKVYQNPSNEAFVVELPVSSGQIDVYNTMGVLLHSQSVSENKTVIDSRLFPDGIYLVKYIAENGFSISKKVMILH